MNKEGLLEMLKLIDNDSKSISEKAEQEIIKEITKISSISQKIYNEYRSHIPEINWQIQYGQYGYIKILKHDDIYIYIIELPKDDPKDDILIPDNIYGAVQRIKIETLIKYGDEEVLKNIKKSAINKRLEILDERIHAAEINAEYYRKEKTKLLNEKGNN